MSTPITSPDIHYDDDRAIHSTEGSHLTPSNFPTRTVAIIKTHSLGYRFDIERRIQEANFEIVKERQMEFDTETDPDTLDELFGEDAGSLAEGPVWVYVLERRKAVEVWLSLMGNKDPELGRQEAPNSLRALYGLSSQQNGLMGSSSTQVAEIQIASLFASSPPFPTTDLPDEYYGSMRSVSSSVLSALRGNTSNGGSTSSTVGGGKSNEKAFRARPLPVTHANPDIVPRTTRSAALRAGAVVEKISTAPRTPLTKERLAETFANVPGHKRLQSIPVPSTAAPAIAPRMTRAASLRMGQQPAQPVTRRRASTTEETTKGLFEGVPGHKRRESIQIASAKPPTVSPRLNKSAALRAQKDQAPPSSFMFRAPTTPKTPGLSGNNSQNSSTRPQLSRPASQASVQRAPPAVRPASAADLRTSKTHETTTSKVNHKDDSNQSLDKVKARRNSTAPTIIPRTNRSAALRAAKQEAQNATVGRKGTPAKTEFRFLMS